MLSPETHAHLLERHRRPDDFGEFAEALFVEHAARFDNVWWAFLDSYAPTHPERIVDLGTGPGLLLADLSERFPEAEVIGVDHDALLIDGARELLAGNEQVFVVEHDLADGPLDALEPGAADLVIASMVLSEMAAPWTALDEAHRMLALGGALVVYDWARRPLRLFAAGRRPDDDEELRRFRERCRFSADDVAFLIEESGFAVREVMTRREGRRLLVAARKHG